MSVSDEGKIQIRTRYVVQKLWPTLKRYWRLFAIGTTLILISTLCEVLVPWVTGQAVDAAVDSGKDPAKVVQFALSFIALVGFKAIVDVFQAFTIQSTGQSITHDLRCQLFEKIEHLPVAYFDRYPTGRLLTRVVNDIKSLSELFTASISVLALDFMIISATVVSMFWMHWKLAAVVLAGFPLVILTIKHFGYRLAMAYREIRALLSEINAFLGENIGAIATIQRLGAETERNGKFTAIVGKHQAASMQSLQVFAMVQPCANVLNGLAMASLIGMGGYWVIQGEISLGVLVTFFGYLRNLFQPIRDLVEKYNIFLSSMVSAERVVKILDEPVEPNPENGVRRGTDDSIAFSNVRFRYSSRNVDALRQLDFKISSGESVAIVGPTGSGKSSIIRLLLGFYEPQEGAIFVGGENIDRWEKSALRKRIGVLHQEIYLFEGTLRDNLLLGRSDVEDKTLIEQCKRSQLWELVKGRGGLEMTIQEGGANLSIGERQLLSFARILVFDPPILVLDEATSSIDPILEKKLIHAVKESLRGRTSVVIAHRLSTIRSCDRVLVLDKGQLVEQGGYQQLLKAGGLFAEFHQVHSRS